MKESFTSMLQNLGVTHVPNAKLVEVSDCEDAVTGINISSLDGRAIPQLHEEVDDAGDVHGSNSTTYVPCDALYITEGSTPLTITKALDKRKFCMIQEGLVIDQKFQTRYPNVFACGGFATFSGKICGAPIGLSEFDLESLGTLCGQSLLQHINSLHSNMQFSQPRCGVMAANGATVVHSAFPSQNQPVECFHESKEGYKLELEATNKIVSKILYFGNRKGDTRFLSRSVGLPLSILKMTTLSNILESISSNTIKRSNGSETVMQELLKHVNEIYQESKNDETIMNEIMEKFNMLFT